jgi:hypothetical protein
MRESADNTDNTLKSGRFRSMRRVSCVIALVACLLANVWLIERAGWTDWGGRWRRMQVQVFGPQVMREKVHAGMSWEQVHGRIGYGKMGAWFGAISPHPSLPLASESEDYPHFGFRVIYRGGLTYFEDSRVVLAIEDMP